MNIGIDARLINETGVGRYIRNLIGGLQENDTTNRYVIYLPQSVFADFALPNKRWEKRLATAHWHTIWEQIVMPFVFFRDRLDLLHVPYFNVPVFYPGTLAVTVHDLTILHVTTGKATTLPYPLYLLRKLGYILVLSIGLRRAAALFTPSNAVKQEILSHFPIPSDRIHVTYEGVDRTLIDASTRSVREAQALPIAPYLLYVGNAYPHKNLDLLVGAFSHAMKTGAVPTDAQLVFVGKDDLFYRRLKTTVGDMGLNDRVVFLADVSDAFLSGLYTHANALVMPSKMEGFGLPALEAATLGTPVVCSDIPVFHEILGDIPQYVDPDDTNAFDGVIAKVLTKPAQRDRSNRAQSFADELLSRFSWSSMVRQTLAVYDTLGVRGI